MAASKSKRHARKFGTSPTAKTRRKKQSMKRAIEKEGSKPVENDPLTLKNYQASHDMDCVCETCQGYLDFWNSLPPLPPKQ